MYDTLFITRWASRITVNLNMKFRLKKIITILAAIFISLALMLMGGMWYLSQNPIFFDKSSLIMKYVPEELTFETLSLKVHSFHDLPELELTNVIYTTPEISVKTPKLHATWRIWNLFQGDFKVAAVTLDQADIQVVISSEHSDKPLLEELQASLSKMPLKYLGAADSQVTILTKNKTWRIDNAALYVLQFAHKTNLKVSGDLQGLKDILTFSGDFSFNLRNLCLTGNFKVKDLILATLPLENKILKKDLSFYEAPLTGEFFFNYDGRREKLDFTGAWKFDFGAPLSLSGTWWGGEDESLKGTFKSPGFSIPLLSKIWLPGKDKARSWVLENVKAGNVEDAQFTLEFKKDMPEGELKLQRIEGSAQLSGGTVVHLKTLPPLTKVKASFQFDDHMSKIQLKQGVLGDLTLENSVVEFSNFHASPLQVALNLNLEGPLEGVSKLLALEPFKKSLPVKMSGHKGQVTAQLQIKAPLKESLKPGELVALGTVNLKGGAFTVQDKSNALAFVNTNLMLTLEPSSRKITGAGSINDLQSSFSWEESLDPKALYKAKTKLEGQGKVAGLLKFLPPALKPHVKSNGGTISLVYVSTEDHQARSVLALDMNFQGSNLSIPALNWSKPKGVPGRVEVDLTMDQGMISHLRKFSLQSKGLEIEGKGSFDAQGHLVSLVASPFKFNNFSGKGTAHLKKGVWHIQGMIPYLNAGPFLDALGKEDPGSKTSEKTPSFSLDLAISILQLKNNIALKNIKTHMELRAGKIQKMNLSGEADSEPLQVKHGAQGEDFVFEIFLPKLDILSRGLDISDKIKTRKVTLRASRPLRDPNAPFFGKVRVEEIRLRDAPVFAKLLSFISLEGMIQNLKGEGLVFTDNEVEFQYKDKEIAIRRAKMMNSSLGITAEGYIYLKDKTLDLHGVLVPANFLNQLVGDIPILGRILTGGKNEGVFSVSYSVKGPFSKPKVSSNPLGILAPNLLKTIFAGITGTGHRTPSLEGHA